MTKKKLFVFIIFLLLPSLTVGTEIAIKKEKILTKIESSDGQLDKKQKVCINKIINGKSVLDKNNVPEQICREIKIHKKLDEQKMSDKK